MSVSACAACTFHFVVKRVVLRQFRNEVVAREGLMLSLNHAPSNINILLNPTILLDCVTDLGVNRFQCNKFYSNMQLLNCNRFGHSRILLDIAVPQKSVTQHCPSTEIRVKCEQKSVASDRNH